MLCSECDNEVDLSNRPVWSRAKDMYVCTFCFLLEAREDKEDAE